MMPDGDTAAHLREQVGGLFFGPARRFAGPVGSDGRDACKKQGRYVILRLMTTKILQEAMRRVEAWPEAAQVELAELALEIDEGFSAEAYRATSEELAGIERGLKDAREGRLATDEQVKAVFDKFRRA
jgi:hypothetical protein